MSEVSTHEVQVQPTDYLLAHRPWLALYNVRLHPKVASSPEVELAPIQQRVLDELMLLILGQVGPYSLGRVACTCRSWRILSEHPKLWQHACLDAFAPVRGLRPAAIQKLLMSLYRGSWRRMFIHHPHLRYDGLYVSRNTYVKTGQADFRAQKTVHLVCYYRYYRFFPDGTLMYRTSPQVLAKVAKTLRDKPKATAKPEPTLYVGKYCLKEAEVFCVVVYPNSSSTEIRTRLSVRSTTPGAYNRLDMRSILSFDRELGTSSDLSSASMDPAEEREAEEGVTRLEYRRGLAPLVFVPWEQVLTSPLNLPAEQMDFYVPG